jgi:uncharacterized protein
MPACGMKSELFSTPSAYRNRECTNAEERPAWGKRRSKMLLSKMNYVIFKLTESCNLKCAYCSAQAVDVLQGNSMPMATFKKTADLFLEGSEQPVIYFVLHGGEPLLMPAAWLSEAMDYALKRAEEHGKHMRFSMQTNGTVFSQKIVDMIKEYKIGVSTSLDGTPRMNDVLRQRGERVVESVKRFRDAGVDLAVITLVNRNNFDKFPIIIDYFLENGIRAVKVNPYYAVGTGHGMAPITAEELFTAKKDFLDHMIETAMKGAVDVNLVHEVTNYATRRQNRQSLMPTCRDKFCAGGITMAGVTPKGDIYPCVRSVGLNEGWLLWNVHEGIDEVEYKRRLNEFHSKDLHYMGCENCEASRICTHGCTAFAKSSVEGDLLECLYTKMMYKYFEERRGDIYKLYERTLSRQRRLPLAPAAEAGRERVAVPAVAVTAMRAMARELTGLERDIDLELIGRKGPLLLYQFEGQKFMYHTETSSLSRIDELAYRIVSEFDRLTMPDVRQALGREFTEPEIAQVTEQIERIVGRPAGESAHESYHSA